MAAPRIIPESIQNGTNPTNLPARYEIRQLTIEHLDWALAIIIHSNIFTSPVWSKIYPDGQPERFKAGMDAGEYLIKHQIESGMSFGIFDTEYKFKNPESEATEGKFYWDKNDTTATRETILEQMDFPLATVAMAYDANDPLDMEQVFPLIGVLPLFGTMYHLLDEADPRDPKTWKADAPRQVLMRNATSTREEYEGKKLMAALARWLMRESASKGYRGINIEAAHDAVIHTWLHPPAPFKGNLISEVDSKTHKSKNEQGEEVITFAPSKQMLAKIYVNL